MAGAGILIARHCSACQECTCMHHVRCTTSDAPIHMPLLLSDVHWLWYAEASLDDSQACPSGLVQRECAAACGRTQAVAR
jgi:hypothetical protein